jgi:hypothetical protein
MICSDAFTGLARTESQVLGSPDFRLVVIPHPLGGLGPGEVKARALAVVDAVVNALTGAAL